jgi:hypothetical protein
MPRILPLLLIAGLCAGCDRPRAQAPKEREFAATLLQGLLAYPHSSVVSVTSGTDAAQATLSAFAPVDTVATWYRQMLRLNGWDLQNDAVMSDGSVSIFALQGKRPLWITLKHTPGGHGTTYTLIGAELPTDSAAAQRSGSSMSSNRIQRR